ncbi:hypothetical protein EIP91_009063 [Steccherinum ochraceum]|uniref:ABM domain-containing protein n=1 Tax=Steccherinum ochraceum TaxID=92696 RepID=A0A4R0RA96_9APHY|nr:hypothetical protein EIP91_009063 [Steccherinum ochraceum]
MAKTFGYTEIARMESTQAYRDDPASLDSTLDMITGVGAKGLNALWTGLQVEDGKTFYMTVVWDDVEDHRAFMADKEYWNSVYEVYCKSALFDITKRDSLLHVPFTTDSNVHMNKPVTEFTIMELKPGQSAAAIEAIIKKEAEQRNELLKDRTSRGRFAWGITNEISEMYVIMTGWDSVEDSEDFRKEYKDRLVNFMTALSDVAQGTTERYRLTRHKA